MGGFIGALASKAGSALASKAGKAIASKFGKKAADGAAKPDATTAAKPDDQTKQPKQQKAPPNYQSNFAAGYGGSRKTGGPIKKTALYTLHKGEYVVPAKSRSGKKATHKKTITKA